MPATIDIESAQVVDIATVRRWSVVLIYQYRRGKSIHTVPSHSLVYAPTEADAIADADRWSRTKAKWSPEIQRYNAELVSKQVLEITCPNCGGGPKC